MSTNHHRHFLVPKSPLLIVILLFFLTHIQSVDASFSDNFNDGDITDWTLSGSTAWSAAGGFASNTISTTGSASYAEKITGSGNYYLVNMSWNPYTGYESYDYSYFKFGVNATNTYTYLYMRSNNLYVVGGLTYTPRAIVANTWYHIKILYSGGDIRIQLYNMNESSLLDEQTSAYSYNNSLFDRIVLQTTMSGACGGCAAFTSRYDDISISDTEPSPSPSTTINFYPDTNETNVSVGITWSIDADDFTNQSPDNIGLIVTYQVPVANNTWYPDETWGSNQTLTGLQLYGENLGSWQQSFINPQSENLYVTSLGYPRVKLTARIIKGLYTSCISQGTCIVNNANIIASDTIIYDINSNPSAVVTPPYPTAMPTSTVDYIGTN